MTSPQATQVGRLMAFAGRFLQRRMAPSRHPVALDGPTIPEQNRSRGRSKSIACSAEASLPSDGWRPPGNATLKLGPGRRFELNCHYCKGCKVCAQECRAEPSPWCLRRSNGTSGSCAAGEPPVFVAISAQSLATLQTVIRERSSSVTGRSGEQGAPSFLATSEGEGEP